jgi:hypothetical protein
MAKVLTPHQRTVLVAITLNDVQSTSSPSGSARRVARCTRPSTTPARKLRARLAADWLALSSEREGGTP